MRRAAEEAAEFSRTTVCDAFDRQIEEMKTEGAVAVVAAPGIEPFREAVAPVYDETREVHGEDADMLLDDDDAIREAMPAG